MNKELKVLKDHLKGPIQRIVDPRDYTTDAIMSSYFREILWLARKYMRPTVEHEDLVVEGLMGLLDAINRWDPDKAKGNDRAFHNLAVVRIKSNMFEYFLSNNSSFTVPNYMARAITLVEQIRNLINSRENNRYTDDALMYYDSPDFDSVTPEKLRTRIKELKDRLTSLGKSSGATQKSYEDMIRTVLRVERDLENFENDGELELNPEEDAEQRDFLTKFLNNLNPAAKEIMSLRLEGKTLKEAGGALDLTRERARQIEEGTIKFFQKTRMFKDAVKE